LLYSVVYADAGPYFDWQCELLEYTWKRVGQPGELLRLVTCGEEITLPRHRYMRVVRTVPQPPSDLGYRPFQRLFALRQWLANERPQGTVLLLDSDMVFRRAVPGEAEPGSPRAQFWADYRPPGPLTQAATWPILIHTSDLERLLPRVIAFTAAIYTATRRWETDMYALVSAAAASGLRFSLEPIGAFVGWPDEVVGECPIVHYCQDVTANNGEILWAKRAYKPWARVPGAERARHSYCRDLLALLDEYAASVS
jgi:hypothetical protein